MALISQQILLQVMILLTVAIASQFLIKRLRQPTVIGEIAIGVILGPTIAVPLLQSRGLLDPSAGGLFDPQVITLFATLGAILLLFLIGLETDVKRVYRPKNMLVAAGGVAVPWVLGFVAAYYLLPDAGMLTDRFVVAMFVGATLVTTSTAIAGAILLDLKMIKTDVAQTIMGAVIVDDILGLLVLSIALGVAGGGFDLMQVGTLIVISVLFIGVSLFFGVRHFSRLVVWMHRRARKAHIRNAGFMVAMAVAFSFSFLSEVIGLSAIVGAFLAGAMFSASSLRSEFEKGVQFIGSIFTPVFFISLGLLVNAWSVSTDLLLFGGVLLAAAFVSKLAGCGLTARVTGMSRSESLAVGYGMIPRGEVGLIAALIGQQQGNIGPGLFSVIVVVTILVSVLPMPLLRRSLLSIDAAKPAVGPPTPMPGNGSM
jgi:Kef-type K+ transport system membrane component KefB